MKINIKLPFFGYLLLGCYIFPCHASVNEKRTLYCVNNLNEYHKLNIAGNEIEMEGQLKTKIKFNSSLLIETHYFLTSPDESAKLSHYASNCPSGNLQVINQYKHFQDFVAVTNSNHISISHFNIKYFYFINTAGYSTIFTNRVTYSGAKNVNMENIFNINLNFIKLDSVF